MTRLPVNIVIGGVLAMLVLKIFLILSCRFRFLNLVPLGTHSFSFLSFVFRWRRARMREGTSKLTIVGKNDHLDVVVAV